MRINEAKRRMLEGKPVTGPVLGLGSPLIAEMFSLAGFDYVMIDNQHGAWDDASTMAAIRGISLGRAAPMARVQKNDYYAIGRLLDQGAMGIVVPMVNSVEEAEAAVFATRYPPRGGRSWGPFGTEFYGPDYGNWVDDEVFLAVQIETREAAEHAEEILSVEGVDGCWIGPNDLGKSLGVDPATPVGEAALEAAILEVLEACKRTGKVPGIWAGGMGQHRLDQGFVFVTVCNDALMLSAGIDGVMREMGRHLNRWGAGE